MNAVSSVFLAQLAMVSYGGALLILTPIFLTPEEQGVWFTMMALGALSRLADMGFVNTTLVYVGHTKGNDCQFSLDSVYAFTSHWRNKVLSFVFPVIFLIGIGVLTRGESYHLSIIFNWFLYLLSIAQLFYLQHKIAFIEGLGFIRYAHSIKGAIYLLAGVSTCVWFLFSPSVTALGGGMLVVLILMQSVVSRIYRELNLAFERTSSWPTHLSDEFVALLKRTAGSWVGGYMGTHAIIPILYLMVGSAVSGAAGVTMNIFVTMQNMSNSFLISKIPHITHLAANRKRLGMKVYLRRNMMKSLMFFCVLSGIVWGGYYLWGRELFNNRIHSGMDIVFLFSGFILQIVIYALAIFIRSQRKEPFAIMSIVTSVVGIIVLYFIVTYSDKDWYFLGFFVSSLLAVVWTVYLVNRDNASTVAQYKL